MKDKLAVSVLATDLSFTCPCCGYIVFNEPPGSYGICPICFWEDDLAQLRFVETHGANRVSLLEAQRNYRVLGAKEQRFVNAVLDPKGLRRDDSWRPFDPDQDAIERPDEGTDYGLSYRDPLAHYYWRARRPQVPELPKQ